MNLVLTTIFIGTMTVTSYRSTKNQTDSSPYTTSIGERVSPHGVAISQDLLEKNGGILNYGDLVWIDGYGFKVVNDVMNKRHKRSVDIWVATIDEERKVGVRQKNVYVILTQPEETKCQKPIGVYGSIVQFVKKILHR